jgi:outer membrane receptor protein involved in Fe transport
VSSNSGFEKDDYNDVDTYGARAALKVDLNDNWTITPQVMAQKMEGNGTFGFDPTIGDLKVAHKFKEKSDDQWYLGSLTLEGKIGNLDMVYAGSYLKRDVDTFSDYSDYSYWYDVAYAAAGYDFASYFYDNAGDPIDFSQYIEGKDRYKRYAHELRFSTPADNRVRFVGGAFLQRQEHGIEQRYKINNLADDLEVSLWPDTIWLTQQTRVDEDRALFGELTFDITDKLSVLGGVRYFETDNSLKGFFGYGSGFSSQTGEAACFDDSDYNGAPCINLDKDVGKDDFVYKANVTYKINDDKMVYLTYAEGFRPGGINRRGTLPPYLPDYLTSYELGIKTTWADGRFRFNGSVFSQSWEDFQFSLLGANGLTEIKNANQARINGIEGDFSWAVTSGFVLNGGFAYLDSELTENYCGFVKDGTSIPETVCDAPEAPEGTELPVTPKFKGNLTGRFEFQMGSYDAFTQASVVYVGKRWADLRVLERSIIGELPDYTTLDLSAGLGSGSYSFELFVDNATDERAELTRFAQCAEAVCGDQTYRVVTRPRTFGLRFGQKF